MDLSKREWKDGKVQLDLAPGAYRLLTAKRMPNGSLFTKEYRFSVTESGMNSLTIRLRDTKISDMLENMDILPFSLKDKDGGKIEAEKLTEGRANILFWLEEGKEPTEHILNELIEHNVSSIARRMYVDPDKLPLIVVTRPGLNGIFATSGYNVGMGDLLLKILAD